VRSGSAPQSRGYKRLGRSRCRVLPDVRPRPGRAIHHARPPTRPIGDEPKIACCAVRTDAATSDDHHSLCPPPGGGRQGRDTGRKPTRGKAQPERVRAPEPTAYGYPWSGGMTPSTPAAPAPPPGGQVRLGSAVSQSNRMGVNRLSRRCVSSASSDRTSHAILRARAPGAHTGRLPRSPTRAAA
jgi:hypothetical protein